MGTSNLVSDIAAETQRMGWPEIRLLGLYGEMRSGWISIHLSPKAWIEGSTSFVDDIARGDSNSSKAIALGHA